MSEQNEKRMAGDYAIFQSLRIGDREVVMGERQDAPKNEKYMCALCENRGIIALHSEVMMSDNYPEIVELFGQRVMEQAQKTRSETRSPTLQGIDDNPLTAKDCRLLSDDDDLTDKVVVIRADVLRREYRCATRQIKLCTGGFGASPHSRGTACYCVNLYTGVENRFERPDILGWLTPKQLPEWARRGLAEYRQEQQAENTRPGKDKGAR